MRVSRVRRGRVRRRRRRRVKGMAVLVVVCVADSGGREVCFVVVGVREEVVCGEVAVGMS